MSVKYIWWGYAKQMIRVYPLRKAQYEDIITPSLVPSNDGLPHGTGVSNPVEKMILSAEQDNAYKEYWAVHQAINVMRQRRGLLFCDFVKLYYWTQPRLKLDEIAATLNLSPRTIGEWNKVFIKLVARNRGWL